MANFGSANIDGVFDAKRTTFNSVEQKVNFNNIKVAENARFDEAFFGSFVDFGGAEIGDQFIAIGAKSVGY